MVEIEARLARAAKDWIDEEARDLGSHPEASLWERYAAGLLDAEQVETLRDHLVACRACRKVMLAAPSAGKTVVDEPEVSLARADAEERRAYAELRKRLDETAVPAEMASAMQALPPPARGGVRWAPYLVALLAFAFAGWSWHQARQPRVGVAIAEAIPADSTRGVSEPAGAVEEGSDRPIAILVPLPGLEAGAPVRVEIVNGAGVVVWRGEGRSVASGELGLEVPARFRKGGISLRLSTRKNGNTQALGTFVIVGDRPAS